MRYSHFRTLQPSLLAPLLGVIVAALLAPGLARAEKSIATGEKTQGLEAALGGPQWKWTNNELKNHLEGAMWAQYKSAKKSLPGPLEIDRLREKTLRRVQRMKAKFVRFDKGSQDYRVSIIDEDFKRGTDEAMLPLSTDDGQQYWFFIQDQLWKMVVAYNADVVQGRKLKTFAKSLRAQFGKPVDLVFEKVGGKDALVAVKWADEKTELVLRARSDPYGTFTLTYTCRPITSRLSELRGEIAGLGDGGSDADASSAMIDDIMTAPDEDPEANVVDELIGGRPEEKKKPEAAPAPDEEGGDSEQQGEDEDAPIIY